jgi:hypothetical protein
MIDDNEKEVLINIFLMNLPRFDQYIFDEATTENGQGKDCSVKHFMLKSMSTFCIL